MGWIWRRGRRCCLRGRRGTWRHRASLCVASMAHTQLVHTQLVTYNLSTHNLSTEGVALADRRGSWRHPPSFHVAGVALTALGGLWWRTGFSADAVDAAALCVAGVALGDIDRHFAWQAWHLWHWTGSGGALGLDLAPWTPLLFAWQAWHLATSSVTLRGKHGSHTTCPHTTCHIQLVHAQLVHRRRGTS